MRMLGNVAENIALTYLKSQGLKLVETNYECKLGEIDLIMRDTEHLVFVEVRYRHKDNYGDGLESVRISKQRKIIRTAKYYLVSNNLYDKEFCRFDVVALGSNVIEPTIEWVTDAFCPSRF